VKTLHLTVVTPQTTVFDNTVEAVIAPLADGWRGVLPGHANFVARVMRGEVVFRREGKEHMIATLGGALSVHGETVVLLTGVAALDHTLEKLEHEIGEENQRLATLEQEAEKHFNRVYRQMASSFNHHRRHRV